jgi:universal stress protein E
MNVEAGKPVVCASDLTDASDEGIRQADALARGAGAPLYVLHVVPNALRHHPLFPQLYPGESFNLAALESRAGELLSQRVTDLTGREGESFRAEVDMGTPYAAIVRRAEELKADVVVVGGRRPDGAETRDLIGDTAEKVVRHAHCPVLVARPGPANGRVLAATDLSDPSLPAVAAGGERARRDGLRLTVLHVLDIRTATLSLGVEFAQGAFPALPPKAKADLRRWADDKLGEALEHCGAEGERLVVEGVPADVILRLAGELPAKLIVIGTAGLTGIRRMLLGSVAEEVVRRAPCSVLVTRLHPES